MTGRIGVTARDDPDVGGVKVPWEDDGVALDSSTRVRFDRIFGEHYESVSRYCHRRLPADDANDATAEVFVVVWRKIDDAPIEGEVLPWLYGIARNEVSRFRRSIRRRGALREKLHGQASHPEPSPEVVVVRNSEQERLVAALGKLKPKDREVLRLRAYEHLALSEIAIVLGCSVSAAKQRSARAIKRLRRAADLPGPQGAVSGSRAIQEGGDG